MKTVVLFYNAILNPGGAERLMFEEAKFLTQKGYRVKILTFRFNPAALFNYSNLIDLETIKDGGFLKRLYQLRKRLKEIKPDYIIAQSAGDSHLLYLTRLNIPYLTHLHGTMFWFLDNPYKYSLIHKRVFHQIRNSLIGHREFIPAQAPKINPYKRMVLELKSFLDYLAIRKSAKVIVLTKQIKWEVEKLYGVEAVISRGCLNPEIFKHESKEDIRQKYQLRDKKIILSVGRLDKRKRIDLLIKCFHQLAEKHKDAVLVIGGRGPEEENLKNLVKQLNLTDKVIFAGFIDDKDLYDYYAGCDIFAFPSWTTSGITPYEALAFGKKVVWTTEAEEPVLNHPLVFLANPNIDDFTQGLEKALETEVSAKIDLTNSTWNNYFQRIYDLLEK
ncbi:MAG: hypothetical protein A3A94_03620 [Candidatus Portnoybacteria bacterium RIFCSPLOWO2_01_FULL_43_11]|uniref:Glycosyltransferase subfamily 4-like N-terminal domain-containing protein n=4 Tax=Bacteria candidate phyla TaxID=1783234 RepID=A0A1G2FSL9_9BACT|nr:MAG: hypothetical protein A2713_01955 [candidate division WWE3 bacterium RIFCSPHIGHO2_01_FULL_35_17]OGZ37423.1 MAG: hypothetical protein A3E90_00610 [Candidatus Portnoybacteria bacterium RIFCSPHIGHO2_12_FULL_40_11]OGZ38439.1 MAG: hypothetical protein A3A94_03620 [Candidatus Portnoybacteria bacterium RIFCSPLOWO2_01_FULL_43_11]OGZ40807.1 MAG: hypothetical protein A3I20_02275 [Candidatus Portnoybacteria bacterium RIFCSPLOWO2_02_FULL_40_15]